jgi:hypothetical protein
MQYNNIRHSYIFYNTIDFPHFAETVNRAAAGDNATSVEMAAKKW